MSVPSHIIDQLNNQADLVSIIGKHTALKKAGNEYKGCCPFHGEKTPSFYVNPQKNFFHCFGCGAKGNPIGFLKEYENLTFMEAVKELGQQTGIEIPKENNANLSYKRTPIKTKPVRQQTAAVLVPTSVSAQQNSTNTASNTDSNESSNQSTNQSIEQNINTADNLNNHSDAASFQSAQQALDDYQSTQADDYQGYGNSYVDGYDNGYGDDYSNSYAESNGSYAYNQAIEQAHNQTTNPNINQTIDQTINQTLNHAINKQDGNLYDLLEQVHAFYQQNLVKYPHTKAYFTERGLSEETISTFGLGYAPSGWQHLETAFPNDIEGLKILGLIRTSEKGRDYNLLRDRVIFVIRDNQGRVVGFAGRALDNSVKPKYINSSDSPVFHKQHVLYGYYESRQHKANDWLVVEGYMDVIALYQAGIYGAVASMGTATNEAQISRLLSLNPILTLSFDGDAAGQKAAWRTLEVSLPILTDDKELRFLTLPDQHDPDTFIAEHGKSVMQEQIKQATPVSQYVFDYLSNRHDLSRPEGKAKLMAEVRTLTNKLPKGSSFKYLLNNYIYQKVGGRNPQKNNTQHLLLDFSTKFTLSISLCLCLLYQPKLTDEDLISKIYQLSKLDNLALPAHLNDKLQQLTLDVIALPNWQDLDDAHLATVYDTVKELKSALPTDMSLVSHFILANLPLATQEYLAPHWKSFYDDLLSRGVLDIEDMFIDMLCSCLISCLQRQRQLVDEQLVKEILNRRRTQLMTWQKSLTN